MGLCFRMGRAETHLASPRGATMPTQGARVSTRALLRNTLLVRSSSRHLGFPALEQQTSTAKWNFCSKNAFVAAIRGGTADADLRVQRSTAGVLGKGQGHIFPRLRLHLKAGPNVF